MPGDHLLMDCVFCDTRLSVPRNVGKIRITCPRCKTEWETSTECASTKATSKDKHPPSKNTNGTQTSPGSKGSGLCKTGKKGHRWRDPRKLAAATIRNSVAALRAQLTSAQSEKRALTLAAGHRAIEEKRVCNELRPFQERLASLKSCPTARKNPIHAFFSANPFTDDALSQIAPLEMEIARRLAAIPEDVSVRQRQVEWEIEKFTRTLAEYEAALEPHIRKEERLEAAQKKKLIQKQRIADLRAAAARNANEARRVAAQVRRRIERQKQCPYCGGSLQDNAQADHIYPLSKGGMSVERNMVFVCLPCNGKKTDLTLAAFIRRFGLDRGSIEERLTSMGKDF